MYPGYRFMDLYPQHSTHMPCATQYGLGFDPVPPQVKLDPAGYLTNYEAWPYGGSHGYPHPAECHACCDYNQFPGYHGYRPQYPHFAPPPSVYGRGSYPAFPATYPVHCVPSPHYSVENPKHEYDKQGPRVRHCCGCPNHLCQQKEDTNVKIEEQDPDDEKKLSDSLVPSQLKNLPRPIVWIPPGYMMNKESKITDGPKSREGDIYSRDEKANGSLKSFEQEPSVWSRWLPIDMNNFGSLNQGGDGKRTQRKQNEDMSKNSFPIFWMPHTPEQVDSKEMNGDQKSSEEPLYLRIPPMKLIDSDDRKSQPKAHEENSDTEAGLNLVGKNVVPQMISVKQKEPSDKTTMLKDVTEKGTIIPVEHKDDKVERIPADDSAKTQSSPPKKSKLPPVCLRVDPLPRRKNNNSSSRSPSRPANKGKSEELLNGSSKSSPSSFMQENNKDDKKATFHLDKSKEEEQRKIKTKTIEVLDGAIRKDKTEYMKEAQTQTSVSLPVNCHEKVLMSETDCQSEKGDRECSFEGDKFESNADDKRSGELTEYKKQTVEGQSANGKCETGVDGGATKAKESEVNYINRITHRKKLSEAEAAVIIQSAYRGFEVRRWEPLKKLKEIAKINEQVTEVRGRVQDLVSSYEFLSNDKQRVVIGETIMSLLLTLDTIQGFNPSIRDIRKSVAKELVSLQEKLDLLTTKRSEASMEKAYEVEHVEDISSSTSDDACTQGKQQVEKDEHKISRGSHDVKSDLAEPYKGQSLPVADVNFSSVAAEKSDPMLRNKEACGDLEEKLSKPDVPSSMDSSYSAPLNEPNGTQTSEVADIGQVPISRPPEEYDALKVEADKLTLPNVAEDELNSSIELTDLSSPVDSVTGKNKDMNVFQELPQRVLNQEPDVQETSKGEVEEMNRAEQQPEELLNECPDASQQNNNNVPGAGEKPEELIAETILGSGLLEVAKVEDVSDTNESPQVYEVEGKVGSVEDMQFVDDAVLEMKEYLAVAPETEKTEPELAVLEDDICEDKSKGHGTNNAGDNSSEFKNINNVYEEKQLPMEEAIQHCVDQKIEAAEDQDMLEEKAKSKEFQPRTSSSNIVDLPCKTAGERVLLEELVPPGAEQTNGDLSALSPTSGTVLHGTVMENDRKLVEENEKLKEMMEKLIEAGKEHLTAISNLSGRVMDLEKKLSRKKKLKTKRYSKSVSQM